MKKYLLLSAILTVFLIAFVTSQSQSCPHGEGVPYCSSLNPNGYFYCQNGVTYSVNCPSSTDVCDEDEYNGFWRSSVCVDSFEGGQNQCPSNHPNGQEYCSSLDPDNYFYCQNGVTYSVQCPSGQVCSNGDCVSSGGNNPSQNQCPSNHPNGQEYCSSLDPDNYFYCQNGVTYSVQCPSGQVCSNGDCVSSGGSSGQPQSCPHGEGTPYCSSLDPNGYFVCQGGITYNYDCPQNRFCDENSYNGIWDSSICNQNPSGSQSCPHGEGVPYCSDLDNGNYFYCEDGVTYSVECQGLGICNEASYNGIWDSSICAGATGLYDPNDPGQGGHCGWFDIQCYVGAFYSGNTVLVWVVLIAGGLFFLHWIGILPLILRFFK